MEIRDNEKFCIFAPLTPIMDKRESERLNKEILNEVRTVGIDLKYVSDCTVDFIETLKNLSKIKPLGIFNIPSDIFAVFNFMGIDKNLSVYVSEQDFESGNRAIINRKFTVI